METHSSQFKVRLGLFVAGGFLIFALAIFLIGRQKNLFNPTFTLSTTFRNVSGMQVGNNIRFSGINVGTIDDIRIINDSTVQVNMIIQKSVQPFIKSDCKAVIGSEGIIGDRILTITQGSSIAPPVKEGQALLSAEPVELDAIIQSLSVTALNAEVITDQLAEIMVNINQGQGTLGMLIQDTTIAENINSTILNLKKSSKGLNQNMEAAKNNFLLRGYFKKKEREAAKAKEAEKKQQEAEDKKKK
jgi:phospholipid/cholesterol/gamma-HCH transport system substrate-binding protein